jgi:hypothetical protein
VPPAAAPPDVEAGKGVGDVIVEGVTAVPEAETASPTAETPGATVTGVGGTVAPPVAFVVSGPFEAGGVPVGVGMVERDVAGLVPVGVRMSEVAVGGAEVAEALGAAAVDM